MQTALLVAVAANQPEIVQDLLSLEADINACDVYGQTTLHLAAHYGFPVVLQVRGYPSVSLQKSAKHANRVWFSQVILSSRPAVNLEARNFEGVCVLFCFVFLLPIMKLEAA